MANIVRNFLIMLKKLQQMHLKLLQKVTGDFIGNKIAGKITKVSRNLQQNNSETVTNEHDKEIHKERYISPEERQEIRAELRLK